jgi:hypothetical protein
MFQQMEIRSGASFKRLSNIKLQENQISFVTDAGFLISVGAIM